MASKRPFRLPSWAPWLLVAALLPFGLLSWLAARATAHRGQAWPALQTVLPRLQDPSQARQLWARNPGLHAAYPTAEAFQNELAEWLPRFGALPAQEPQEAAETYALGSDPFQVRIALRGQGGAWLSLVLEDAGPFGSASSGEGISRLLFAGARAELSERQQRMELKRTQALWARYRQVESQLRDEAGARRLWASEAALRRSFKAEEDLLKSTAPWRRARPCLPADLETAPGATLRIHDTPMGRTESVGYPGPEGLMLWVTWRDGSLEGLEPTLEAHGH